MTINCRFGTVAFIFCVLFISHFLFSVIVDIEDCHYSISISLYLVTYWDIGRTALMYVYVIVSTHRPLLFVSSECMVAGRCHQPATAVATHACIAMLHDDAVNTIESSLLCAVFVAVKPCCFLLISITNQDTSFHLSPATACIRQHSIKFIISHDAMMIYIYGINIYKYYLLLLRSRSRSSTTSGSIICN